MKRNKFSDLFELKSKSQVYMILLFTKHTQGIPLLTYQAKLIQSAIQKKKRSHNIYVIQLALFNNNNKKLLKTWFKSWHAKSLEDIQQRQTTLYNTISKTKKRHYHKHLS